MSTTRASTPACADIPPSAAPARAAFCHAAQRGAVPQVPALFPDHVFGSSSGRRPSRLRRQRPSRPSAQTRRRPLTVCVRIWFGGRSPKADACLWSDSWRGAAGCGSCRGGVGGTRATPHPLAGGLDSATPPARGSAGHLGGPSRERGGRGIRLATNALSASE